MTWRFFHFKPDLFDFLLQELFKLPAISTEIINNGFQAGLVVRQASQGVPVMAANRQGWRWDWQ
jgi:hypothetical protein